MYTTIQDPNSQVYTSGSETYAQIQPVPLSVTAEINQVPSTSTQSTRDDQDGLYEPAPQPPSVDTLKQVAHSHSRQGKIYFTLVLNNSTITIIYFKASSSSSIANLGSPKPEKRQANSPLPPPPPPSITPDLFSPTEKLRIPKNLDDMYAKVQKNRKKNDTEVESPTDYPVVEVAQLILTEKVHNEITTVNLPATSSYEHKYETLKKSPRKQISDVGYEKLRLKDQDCSPEPGYASINGPESISGSDPGYEVLKQNDLSCSDTDPNYEELCLRNDMVGYSTISEALSCSDIDCYSSINKSNKLESSQSKTSSSFDSDPKDLSLNEPNYESMLSETSVNKTSESELSNDPNYESVKYSDFSSEDPPYEQLKDDESSRTDSYQNYEKLDSLKIDSSSGDSSLRQQFCDKSESLCKDEQKYLSENKLDNCEGKSNHSSRDKSGNYFESKSENIHTDELAHSSQGRSENLVVVKPENYKTENTSELRTKVHMLSNENSIYEV